MKIMFLNVNASQSVLENSKISLSYVLRLRMEVVRPQIANTVAEFYWLEIFVEDAILKVFLENLENLENLIFKKRS